MRLEEKKQAVDDLAEKVQSASVIISTDYGGLTVSEMTDLRRKLRAQQIEFRVIKNTLARFAAMKAGKEDLNNIIVGTTAMVFGYDDIAVPAKILLEYIRSTKSQLKISGGLVENRVLSAAEVATLATIPPKEVLVAKLLGSLNSPLYGLVTVLNANISGLTYVLSARQKQLEKGG
jgi:large subunit ribosomal protein L10